MIDTVASIISDCAAFGRELAVRTSADGAFADLARGVTVAFELRGQDWAVGVNIVDGEITGAESEPWFTLEMLDDDWRSTFAASPSPGDQSILAAIKTGRARLIGDELAFAQHVQLVRRLIEVIRGDLPTHQAEASHRELSLRGEYVRVEIPQLGICDVFVERAGSGVSLVCLATAGSDSRQYHGLVTETDIVDRHELIAFDLPWHGKSNPAWGRRSTEYSLTSASYVGAITAVVEALDLDDLPILVGSSMAGAVVVEAVARRPELFRGAIACQAGPRVTGRRTAWLRSPVVNQALHIPEWTYGLMSPESPFEMRDRVWWGYSQGGFGAYDADLGYYSQSWDIDNVRHLLSGSSPHIVVMSGAYDTSVPTTASEALAAAIPNSSFRVMPELGHFPHAENPRAFAPHLQWAIGRILDTAPSEGHDK